MPSRADFDAPDFSRAVLPKLGLIEVEHAPLRFRYRLTGTAVDEAHGANMTGMYVEDVARVFMRDDLQPDLEALVDRKVPQLVLLQCTNIHQYHRRHYVLRLPLSGDGPDSDPLRVDRILVAFEQAEPIERAVFTND